MLYILPPLRSQSTPPTGGWRNVCVGAGDGGAEEKRPRPPKTRLRNLKVVPRNDETSEFQGIVDTNRNSKSLSECYFAGKGTALVLPDADATTPAPSIDVDTSTMGVVTSASDHSVRYVAPSACATSPNDQNSSVIQRHLQSMFYLLRPEETLKMAVKLESVHPVRTRYLVVVSRMGSRGEESCLLGIDCNEETTVGLVLRVLADTKITLDGDGGFSVSICDSHHIFKPVSVQAMWSALQTLHKVSGKAREGNYYPGGGTHSWVDHYENRVASDRSCLNEWHAMDCLESKRPPSPDSVRARPIEREETEKVIRSTLKEIMMSVDLDEVTSKFIRSRLEEQLDMDLGEFKSFIDQEMLVILGQMDAPTEIFEHVYLGSEWNASNYEELQRNGVGHILNVTREIDNFFPGTFDYLNVRVYDDEKTDLLKHWDDTFKYITKAKNEGSKVLVHCKMGISRSASVVIAYAMKAYNWDFNKALLHVRDKRSCIKPNTNFLTQLETYQGILDAMKNKEKLQRSKSETNLKSPTNINKPECKSDVAKQEHPLTKSCHLSGQELRQIGERPKSWSPDNLQQREDKLLKTNSMSLEDLSQKSTSKDHLARHVLLPCDNGESYSVSPNQIVHLPGQATPTLNNDPWDPGEDAPITSQNTVCDNLVWRSTAILVTQKVISDDVAKVPDDVIDRECPSRQSSWSSYDSAIVVNSGSMEKTELSRHSSWGSGDNRIAPSRNSSWGSYDLRPRDKVFYSNEKGEKVAHPPVEAINPTIDKEDTPHPGTVKRTKQLLENSKSGDIYYAEAINDTLLDRAKTAEERLSTSAPEPSQLDVEGGKVQNLKKEFEAKGTSLPTSPVCLNQKDTPTDVQTLRSVFEKDDKVPRQQQRFSCIDFSKRPPPRPAVKQIAATVIATAQKKQQQYGKTHPLARIPIKPRHNNPVYNTM